ncbi:unnamed protein product [Cylicocyclus nassatus]|uniref:Secreted protein n=1 Tax=Cylicocyclus nassatus TaxID=53992 RepID=A0AA36HER4_CYLNA|nr:unnamed protein product [Cylicocyclus nassatus]
MILLRNLVFRLLLLNFLLVHCCSLRRRNVVPKIVNYPIREETIKSEVEGLKMSASSRAPSNRTAPLRNQPSSESRCFVYERFIIAACL